jgi:hypothetical protein
MNLYNELVILKAASKGLQDFVAKLAVRESWLFWSVAALHERKYHPHLGELLLWNKFYYSVKLFTQDVSVENMLRIGQLYAELCEIYSNHPCVTEKRDVSLVFTSNNRIVATIKVAESEVVEATAELFKFFDSLNIEVSGIEARGLISNRETKKITR